MTSPSQPPMSPPSPPHRCDAGLSECGICLTFVEPWYCPDYASTLPVCNSSLVPGDTRSSSYQSQETSLPLLSKLVLAPAGRTVCSCSVCSVDDATVPLGWNILVEADAEAAADEVYSSGSSTLSEAILIEVGYLCPLVTAKWPSPPHR